MPGGNRTGPLGRGPMTGRGLGLCSGNPSTGFFRPRFGQGFRRGFWGRGRGVWYQNHSDSRNWSQPSEYPEMNNEERVYLEDMVKNLEQEIKEIKNRIKNLSKDDTKPLE